MVHELIAAALMAAATSPVAAASAERTPPMAPAESADARYCLRVDPATGSLIETIRCWTRDQWAEQGVSVDEAWAKEGVGIKR